MESLSFSLGSAWEDTSGSFVSQVQRVKGASDASNYNHAIAYSVPGPSAEDPLFDGHLIPLGEGERPNASSSLLTSHFIDERQRKRCKSEAALPI
jgi:hypothetical protein